MTRFAQRRDRLRKLVARTDAEALLVTNFINVTYLTGFTGDDSYLLLMPNGETLISDMRYTTQLEEECPGLDLHIRGPGTKMHVETAKVLKKSRVRQLGIEGDSMSLSLQASLAKEAPKISFVTTSGLVERLRMIKDKFEIERTRVACYQAKRAFEVVRASLTPDMTERQVHADLEYQTRRFGGKGLSFTPIVGVGARAALPHGQPSDVRIGESPFVLIDWGAIEGLYMSDLTRVLVTGRLPAKLAKIYNITLKAQRQAIKAIRPGMTCKAVDKVARDIIGKAGFGKQFGHGLGHGVGLEIHEAPRLAADQEGKLQPGMIVTVEPGIYFPGWGGVRIEDDVLVTRSGHEVLTDVATELDECVVG